MDFLRETKFTFSAFWKKKSQFIHPAVTQIWAGPRTKSEKEDAASPILRTILARKVKLFPSFFCRTKYSHNYCQANGWCVWRWWLTLGWWWPFQPIIFLLSQVSLRLQCQHQNQFENHRHANGNRHLRGFCHRPAKATRSQLTAAEIRAVTMENGKGRGKKIGHLRRFYLWLSRNGHGELLVPGEFDLSSEDILAGLFSRFPIMFWWIYFEAQNRGRRISVDPSSLGSFPWSLTPPAVGPVCIRPLFSPQNRTVGCTCVLLLLLCSDMGEKTNGFQKLFILSHKTQNTKKQLPMHWNNNKNFPPMHTMGQRRCKQ